MMDLVFKERSGGAYAQDLVIHVIVYGILGHHNDVVLSVWDRKFEKLMTLWIGIWSDGKTATSTNNNDTANKSYVDGVKQAAALSLYLYTFFNYEMGHDNKNETKFWKSRPKYAVSNDLHFTLYSEQ